MISFLVFYAKVAFSGAPYLLDWPRPTEILKYHSCGCADSCWVAELLDKKTKAVKIVLSCDCTKLSVSYGQSKEKIIIGPDCKEFESLELNSKPKLIAKKIEELIKK